MKTSFNFRKKKTLEPLNNVEEFGVSGDFQLIRILTAPILNDNIAYLFCSQIQIKGLSRVQY